MRDPMRDRAATAEYRNLADGEPRRRFCREFEKNFSVIAPAGVGKTRAIVDRVINITLADGETPASLLPQLLVVTYTRKAAEEMKARTRGELLRRNVHPDKIGLFDQVFFGSIHSLCLDIVRNHGYVMGISSSVDLVEREEPLWLEFVRARDDLTAALPREAQAHFQRHAELGGIVELARQWPDSDGEESTLGPYPEIDLTAALNFVPYRRSRANVEAGQRRLSYWSEDLADGVPYLPLPNIRTGGKEFVGLVEEAFLPLRKWLSKAAQSLVRALAEEYRRYRVERGLLTYDDMVSHAVQLLRLPESGRNLRSRGYRVILDEAQDTDAAQFEVLLGLTQSPDDWREGQRIDEAPPGPGRFCMVGDPQQSIYGSRVNLSTYLDTGRQLEESGGAEVLRFSVTFRCDVEIVRAVNGFFPRILDGRAGQVAFEPLRPRPDAGPGTVIRCKLSAPDSFDTGVGVEEAAGAEALALGRWLADRGLSGLGVSNWQEVAILCPRKNWLLRIHYALREVGLASVIHSRGDTRGDNPSFAWLTGLLVCQAEPDNGFEVVGVLRDIFGISDHDLARYVHGFQCEGGKGNPFQISVVIRRDGTVGDTLNQLARLRETCAGLALRDAVETLIEETQLRERLEALPGYPTGYLARSLDACLTDVANSEEEGGSLQKLAGELRAKFDQLLDEEDGERDQICLITCHRAKGLEWDVVILPHLFREIGFPQERYPRVFHAGEGPRLVLGRALQPETLRARQQRLRRQEYERLLYVAATRARKFLVLVDFEGFQPRAKAGSNFSFAQLLQIQENGHSRAMWKEFPESSHSPVTDLETIETDRLGEISSQPLEKSYFRTAREVGNRFIRHRTPSTLDRAEWDIEDRVEADLLAAELPDEIEADASLDADAYGTWWHTMMEINPWEAGVEAWSRHFDDRLKSCRDSVRGRREVKLFEISTLSRVLQKPDLVIRTEVPFLWRSGQFEAFDGVIDLVAWDPKEGSWLIVDWKTVQLSEGDTRSAMDRYLAQVSAYRDAVRSLRGEAVKSWIFWTSSGTFVAI